MPVKPVKDLTFKIVCCVFSQPRFSFVIRGQTSTVNIYKVNTIWAFSIKRLAIDYTRGLI